MRPITLFLAAACLLTACGGTDEPAPVVTKKKGVNPPKEAEIAAGDPATRVDPKADYVAYVDVTAYREANDLAPDADVSQDANYRQPVSAALAYLLITGQSPVEKAIDHKRVTRAIFDGDAVIVATTQPFAEIAESVTAAGATEDDGVLVGDPFSVGEAGPGLVVVGFDPDGVRAVQQRTDGAIPPRLQAVLDRAGEHPIRAATLDPEGACVKSVAVGAGTGEDGTVVVEVEGKASPGRLRLGKPVGNEHGQFLEPDVKGSRLIVPFSTFGTNPTSFIGQRVYRC